MPRKICFTVSTALVLVTLVVLSLGATPRALAQDGNVVVANASYVSVRSGPAINTIPLGSVPGGTVLPVTGRNAGTTWWRVETAFGVGWVSDAVVAFRGSLSSVPVVSEPAGTLETATVIADSYPANVYRNPDTNSFVIGMMPQGATLPVTGRTNDGEWWQVSTPAGLGFVSATEVSFRGDIALIPRVADPGPTFDGPTVRVNTEVSVVTQPGGTDVIGTLTAGTTLPAIGRTADNTWWQVADVFGIGWIPVRDVSLAGAAYNIRITSEATFPSATVRTGKSFATVIMESDRKIAFKEATFDIPMWVAGLGEQGGVVARSEDGLWLEVTVRGYAGWMNFSGLTLQGDLASLPMVDITPPPVENIAIVDTHWLNVRSGPGVEYERVGAAPGGARLAVTGKHPTLPWLRVEGADFGVGWVRIMHIIFRGDWNAVPLVTEPVGNIELPVAVVEIPHHVYSQPDLAYPAGTIAEGIYTIVGWTSDYDWALIETPLGDLWILATEFALRGIAASSPIVAP